MLGKYLISDKPRVQASRNYFFKHILWPQYYKAQIFKFQTDNVIIGLTTTSYVGPKIYDRVVLASATLRASMSSPERILCCYT